MLERLRGARYLPVSDGDLCGPGGGSRRATRRQRCRRQPRYGRQGRRSLLDAWHVWVAAASQAPWLAVSSSTSASIEARMAWMGMRPDAIIWPPARRAAEANGAAHRF